MRSNQATNPTSLLTHMDTRTDAAAAGRHHRAPAGQVSMMPGGADGWATESGPTISVHSSVPFDPVAYDQQRAAQAPYDDDEKSDAADSPAADAADPDPPSSPMDIDSSSAAAAIEPHLGGVHRKATLMDLLNARLYAEMPLSGSELRMIVPQQIGFINGTLQVTNAECAIIRRHLRRYTSKLKGVLKLTGPERLKTLTQLGLTFPHYQATIIYACSCGQYAPATEKRVMAHIIKAHKGQLDERRCVLLARSLMRTRAHLTPCISCIMQ